MSNHDPDWSTIVYPPIIMPPRTGMTLEDWADQMRRCRRHCVRWDDGRAFPELLTDEREWQAHGCDHIPAGAPRPPAHLLVPMVRQWDQDEYDALPEVVKHSRRERSRMTRERRARILARDRECQQCGATALTTKLEIDHIVAVSHFGMSDDSNLQVLCRPCNRRKAVQERRK